MQDDRLAQIEKMLAQGMTEEQIIAALGGGKPAAPAAPYNPLAAAGKATSIRPEPPRMPRLAREALRMFTGIVDPIDIENENSLPLPFTEKRLLPADAALNAVGWANFAKQIPAGIRSLLGRSSQRAMNANTWANAQYPTRTLSPRRMLGPGSPATPDIPLNTIDNELVSLAPDPLGGFNFIPQEAFETSVYGTLNPGGGRIIPVGGGKTVQAVTKAAKKTKKR